MSPPRFALRCATYSRHPCGAQAERQSQSVWKHSLRTSVHKAKVDIGVSVLAISYNRLGADTLLLLASVCRFSLPPSSLHHLSLPPSLCLSLSVSLSLCLSLSVGLAGTPFQVPSTAITA